MAEDRTLQSDEIGRRIEAEFVEEVASGAVERAQRIRLAARAVQREHQLCGEPLLQRVLVDRALQLPHRRGVAAEREHRVEPARERRDADLVEPYGRGRGPFGVDHVGQRRPAPPRGGTIELFQRAERIARGELLGTVHAALVGDRVELVRQEVEHVAGPVPTEPPRVAERATQARHVAVQRRLDRQARVGTPDVVDESIDRDEMTLGEREPGEHRSLSWTADPDRLAVAFERRRAEDAQDQPVADVRLLPRSRCHRAPDPRCSSAPRSQRRHRVVVAPRRRAR